MSWEYVTLDKLGDVSRGRSKHRPRNDSSLFGGDYPFIQTADVKDSPFYITSYNDTYNEKGLSQSRLWNKGTLCITIAANIADTAILGIDACFPDSVMGKHARIADVLVAYEDLIENNQKQIKLLEEAAQRLYKEWFIDLRFPGHEEVEIIDGVPEGWKKIPLGNVLQVVRGRSYSSKELSDKEGVLMVNLSNIRPYGGYNRDQEKHYTGKVNDNQFVDTHDLLMGVTDMTQERRTVGRVAIVPNLHAKAMISMDLIKLVPDDGSPLFYYALLNYGYSEVISRFANGTNVLHLRPDVLDIVDAVIPDIRLQNKFVEFFENIQNRLNVLQDEMIESARKQVVSYLIKELKVDEISSIIINDSMSDLDKQYAIMGYISTKIVPAKMNTAFNIAEINGRLIEVGKLLELFFMYNNIHYKINGEAKEKSIYEVKVDGINYKLDPKDMYNATYGVLSDYLHYTEADGNRYYLSLLDENNYREYRTKIDRSVLVGAYVDEEVFNKGVKKSLVI